MKQPRHRVLIVVLLVGRFSAVVLIAWVLVVVIAIMLVIRLAVVIIVFIAMIICLPKPMGGGEGDGASLGNERY